MPLLRDYIYRAIRQAILTAEFQPGKELREQILAERYHVSRSPIRNSLLRLEREDLVTVLPRRGYLVRPISVADVEDILCLRLIIEPACVEEAARLDGKALQGLDGFRGFADSDFTNSRYVEYNASFHRAIAALSPNRRLAEATRNLTDQFERLVRVSMRSAARKSVQQVSAEHDAIIDAIQAHDCGLASRLTREHAQDTRAGIVTALQALPEDEEQHEDLTAIAEPCNRLEVVAL